MHSLSDLYRIKSDIVKRIHNTDDNETNEKLNILYFQIMYKIYMMEKINKQNIKIEISEN